MSLEAIRDYHLKCSRHYGPRPTEYQRGVLQGLGIAMGFSSTECVWKYDEDDCFYSTACGNDWSFEDGKKHDSIRFCPGCGKPVKEIKKEEESYQ